MVEGFFAEQAEQSAVKSAIVTKYFWAWAKVMLGAQKSLGRPLKIGYIDLFAGPGRYKDGKVSTPILILEQAIKEPQFRDSLVTVFNDGDSENTSELIRQIDAIDNVRSLKFTPKVYTNEVGEKIVAMFESMDTIPILFFVDPFGYKGLSLRLINSVIKNWGCECIFFFNYNRVNPGLTNTFVDKHMAALFGDDRALRLKAKIVGMSPNERELTIVEELCEALIEMGGKYTLPFRFRNAKGTRTSHHLIFVSKAPKGYHIMKEVMAKESSSECQGVPSFEYNPASNRQRLLFEFNRPLDDLEGMLLSEYQGRTMSMKEVFESHNYGRPYISRNYKSVLLQMEKAGKISTDQHYTLRKFQNGEYTFADKVKITFPKLNVVRS